MILSSDCVIQMLLHIIKQSQYRNYIHEWQNNSIMYLFFNAFLNLYRWETLIDSLWFWYHTVVVASSSSQSESSCGVGCIIATYAVGICFLFYLRNGWLTFQPSRYKVMGEQGRLLLLPFSRMGKGIAKIFMILVNFRIFKLIS